MKGKSSIMKMMKKSPAKERMDILGQAEKDRKKRAEAKKPKKTTFAEAYKKRNMKTYGNLSLAEFTKEAKRQSESKTAGKGFDAPKSQMKGSVKPSDKTTKAKAAKLPVGDRKLKKVTTKVTPKTTTPKTKNEIKKQKRLARNEKQKAMAKDLKYRLLGKAGRAKMEAKGYVPKSKRK